jgi:DNA-binding NtrC family response regulator
MNTKPIKLLLVDDEDEFRGSCAKWMKHKGLDVSQVGSGAAALSQLESTQFDVVVLDVNMPGMSGVELLQRIHDAEIEVEILMLTGESSVATAVAAMKLGACDYIAKPCALADLEHHIQLAYDRGQLRKENRQLKAVIGRSRKKTKLIGNSSAMKDVLRTIQKVAPTDSPVLIQGDSGTGKEVVASLIQEASSLRDKPFVTINCAALPEQLVESELFGHQKGAFTGATSEKPGLFEIADGGTMFIDEIGELPLALQPKLLRVLEDGSLRRVGSHQERRVNVRLIAATNRNLGEEVSKKNFREDLFYRINVVSIELPRLQDRPGDVNCLIDHYLSDPWSIDDSAREAMNQYSWPGNVRQLMNVLQRARVLADHHEITLDDLPSEVAHAAMAVATNKESVHSNSTPFSPMAEVSLFKPTIGDPRVKLDELAQAHILEVLAKEDGNKAAAARKLGIHRRKLYRLLERFERAASRKGECNTC